MPPPNTPEEGMPAREPGDELDTPTSGPPRLSQRFAQLTRPQSAGSSEPSDSPPSIASPSPVGSSAGPPRPGSPGASRARVPEIPPMDYQALAYPQPVDETLQCPICKTAFHEPVTTKTCGHTFCTACLKQAFEIQPICPIDRQPLKFPQDTYTTRVITHQLDRLLATCPNQGCDYGTTRTLLEAHYERYCKFTPVYCPDPTCQRRVRRCDATAENGCLHGDTQCIYCSKEVVVAELEAHYDTECSENKSSCPSCGSSVVRHLMDKHIATQCPETEIRCQWHTYGCPVESKRSAVEIHEASPCVYQAIGRLAQDKAEDRRTIDELRGRLAALETSPRTQTSLGSQASLDDLTQTQAGASSLWDPPEDFLLSQLANMETSFEEMRKNFTELDSRHSMMLLNETLPLKNQITELRSIVGVVNMHTTWLMNFHRQQRSAAAAGSAVMSSNREQNSASSARSSAEDEPVYQSRIFRRLSDGRNEQAPRL